MIPKPGRTAHRAQYINKIILVTTTMLSTCFINSWDRETINRQLSRMGLVTAILHRLPFPEPKTRTGHQSGHFLRSVRRGKPVYNISRQSSARLPTAEKRQYASYYAGDSLS